MEEAIALHFVENDFLGGVLLWRNPRSVVMGISQDIHSVVIPEAIEAWKLQMENQLYNKHHKQKKQFLKFAGPDFLYIARRSSGGGTVYQTSTENLNFSLFCNLKLRQDLFPVAHSYETLLGFVISALKKQNISASLNGKSDLAMETNSVFQKFSGNAQFRKKNCLVHHGTLILDSHLIEESAKVLLHPPEEPEYRKKRSHKDFLKPLPNSFDAKLFQKDLSNSFREFLGEENTELVKMEEMKRSPLGMQVKRKTVQLWKNKFANLEFILEKKL